jgi:hypothetical protein
MGKNHTNTVVVRGMYPKVSGLSRSRDVTSALGNVASSFSDT